MSVYLYLYGKVDEVFVSSVVCIWRCFFFQAEDGIRDLVRSRGLGDVYKRQTQSRARRSVKVNRESTRLHPPSASLAAVCSIQSAVSYTHLTLPTSDLV